MNLFNKVEHKSIIFINYVCKNYTQYTLAFICPSNSQEAILELSVNIFERTLQFKFEKRCVGFGLTCFLKDQNYLDLKPKDYNE